MYHYPVAFFVKGDVVYDENKHLLLRLDFITRSGLPVFVVIGKESGYSVEYTGGRILSDTYSQNIKHLQYVCKISSFTRMLNRYKIYHRFPDSPIGNFLRNFTLIGTR